MKFVKKNALIPSERAKECLEHWFSWTGKIPCTGQFKCTMCGAKRCSICQGILAPGFSGAHELCKARQSLGKPIERIDYVAPSADWQRKADAKGIREL